MKVSDVIQCAANLMSLPLPSVLFALSPDSGAFEEAKKTSTVVRLVDCCNAVSDELAAEFAPIYKKTTIAVENCLIPYAAFDGELMDVFCLKDVNGAAMPFYFCEEGVSVSQNCQVEALYSVRPAAKGFSDELCLGVKSLSLRSFAYGVCAEFCLLDGRYDEMSVWDSRFKNAVEVAVRKKMPAFVAERRWLC